MTPMAIYSEKQFNVERQFQLYDDRIVVTGRVPGKSEFITEIPLSSLNPDFGRASRRNGIFWIGLIWICLFSWCFVSNYNASTDTRVVAMCVTGFMILIGLGVAVVSFPKVESVRFSSNAGIVILDVAKAGKEKDKFAAFVETLTKQIKAVKERS